MNNLKIQRITTVIHTYNSGQTIEKALKSVLPLGGDILIIDMHSTDNTLEVCRKFNCIIHSHQNVGFADPARQFGLSKVQTKWVWVLDSDEWVDTGLCNEVLKTIEDNNNAVRIAFYIRRKNQTFGSIPKWGLHGYLFDKSLRLFTIGSISYGSEPHNFINVNQSVKIRQLKSYIFHLNYISTDEFFHKQKRYLALSRDVVKLSPRSNFKILVIFVLRFFNSYFLKLGLLDGSRGLLLSISAAYHFLALETSKKIDKDK